MSTKTEAQALVKAFFESNADSDKMITAAQLTDMISDVTSRDYSAKTIRHRLRQTFTRENEFKNATWRVTATIAVSELAYYMTRNQKKAS